MSRLKTRFSILLVVLVVGISAPRAKADQITQVFTGYTFNAATGQRTSTVTGSLTLNTSLLPSGNSYAGNVDPFSSFQLTLTETNGTVIQYNSLATSIYPFYGTNAGGGAGCSFLSGSGVPCQTLLSFASNSGSNFNLITQMQGYFNQSVQLNYDNTDAPTLGLPPGLNVLRGSWAVTPEPGTWLLVIPALLLVLTVKGKSLLA